MSCHGTCRTPLFELNVQHVITMDDIGGPKNPMHSHLSVFARVYRWELDLVLRKPRGSFYVSKGRDYGNIPYLFGWDVSFDSLPARQYSGDLDERMHDDPYYGQKPL